MKSPLRILHLEDDPRDSDLVQDTLEADGLPCLIARVETESEFIASLGQGGFDLILADYTLPSFDGLSALKIARRDCPNVPFIFLSGTLGEEVAIEALKIGATDYVFKTRLFRIVPSVQRALREAGERTALAHAAEALRRSETYLAEAQKLSHTGSFGWDISSGEIYWSRETFRIFGYEPAEKATIEQVVRRTHPEDRPLVQKLLDRVSREAEPFDYEHRLLMPDGTVKHVRVVGHPSRHAAGRLEFVGAVTDTTDRKQSEEKLKRSEASLADGQRLTQSGSWSWNVRTHEAYWSQEMFRIFGFDPENTKAAVSHFLDRIHPEDRPRVEQILAEERSGAGVDIVSDYRIVLPDRTIKHIHAIAHPVTDPSGEVVEVIGTSMDVTATRIAEERIRQDERELRQIVDTVAQLVVFLSPDGRAEHANRHTLEYTGLSLEDVKAQNFRERIFHPEDLERIREERRQALSLGVPFENEQRVRRKDGQYRWFFIRYNALRDEHGRPIRWYAAGIDINDRKQAEEKVQSENQALREEIDRSSMFEEIVGTSAALKEVLSRVSKVAPTDSTVLITGETGAGKELIARAVHRRSRRSSRVFISVNCATIPRDLIASELFGHEKGSFTGATQRRVGRFELAEGGTIFLDEVGELPAHTQIALLRVLQEHEFERVGGNRSIHSNVRVIAATNRDLQGAIEADIFRRDLFYRLNVFPIEVPSLRERREDIPMLVEYFIDRYARKLGKKIRGVNKKTLSLLQAYPWPGNIRELQNVIERSVIVCETENLSVDESWLQREPITSGLKSNMELNQELAAQEKEIIEAALRECGGRVSGSSGAAARLGIHRSTLESKIQSLKIDKYRFKSEQYPSKNV